MLFVTAADGGKLLTIALDAASGKERWRHQAPRSRSTKIRAKNTEASPSPVTDGEIVYVFFEDFGLLAYSVDGKERWRKAVEALNTPYGPGASPILVDGKLILVCDQDTDSYILAVSLQDGRTLWKKPRPEATHGFATPIVYRPASGVPPNGWQLPRSSCERRLAKTSDAE